MRKTGTAIIIFILASCMLLGGCRKKGVSARQWVIDRADSLELIRLFCENMDEVVSLYVSGTMTTEAYLEEMYAIDMELRLMEEQRETEEILPGTHTYETKLAQESYDGVWADLREMVDSLRNDESLIQDPDRLTYYYMAYSESIMEKLKQYTDGYVYAAGEPEDK